MSLRCYLCGNIRDKAIDIALREDESCSIHFKANKAAKNNKFGRKYIINAHAIPSVHIVPTSARNIVGACAEIQNSDSYTHKLFILSICLLSFSQGHSVKYYHSFNTNYMQCLHYVFKGQETTTPVKKVPSQELRFVTPRRASRVKWYFSCDCWHYWNLLF